MSISVLEGHFEREKKYHNHNFSGLYFGNIEGAQTVKCKPWTERVADEGLSRQVSRAAWKRRINRELEGKKAHKPWIREGLNREVQTVN